MAKLIFWRCELCRKLEETKPTARLVIENKAESKVSRRITICTKCFNDLLVRIDSPETSSFKENFDMVTDLRNKELSAIHRKMDENTSIIPSKNIRTASNAKPACLHERNSFEENHVVCKDCGEKSEL